MAKVVFTKVGLQFELEWDIDEGIPLLHSQIVDCCIAATTLQQEAPKDLLPEAKTKTPLPPPPQQQQQQTQKSDRTGTFDVDFIRHTYEAGQHRFKLCGGNFTRWGVPVYDDSVRGDRNLIESIFGSELGDTPVANMRATVLFADNGAYKKPVKVLEVV